MLGRATSLKGLTMCRNITELRGLEPPAMPEEVTAAARQYVRKVTGIRNPNAQVEPGYEAAVAQIAQVTAALLADLPPRRQPPAKTPPMRIPHIREKMGLPPLQ